MAKPCIRRYTRGFALLRRTWNSGDLVTLDLPQSLFTEAIDDLHPETVAVLRGPLVYVALNPPAGPARLASLDGWKTLAGSPGIYRARSAGTESLLAPLYFVREESYTTYFQKS